MTKTSVKIERCVLFHSQLDWLCTNPYRNLSFLTVKRHPIWTPGYYTAFLVSSTLSTDTLPERYDQGTRFGAVLDMVTDRYCHLLINLLLVSFIHIAA